MGFLLRVLWCNWLLDGSYCRSIAKRDQERKQGLVAVRSGSMRYPWNCRCSTIDEVSLLCSPISPRYITLFSAFSSPMAKHSPHAA